RARVFFREYRMTVRQLIEAFGRREGSGTIDWSRFSTTVKNLYDKGNLEAWVDVCHVIHPNEDYDPSQIRSRFKRLASCYYEQGGEGDKLLHESGYDLFPVLAPRWEGTVEDSYGINCPGMTSLPDIKELQHSRKKGAQALDKLVDP